MPYIRVILSYYGGLCHEWFGFYGYFSLRGFHYFCLNDGILMRKLKFAYGCRITKCLFKRLDKVAMRQKLLVIKVMNGK